MAANALLPKDHRILVGSQRDGRTDKMRPRIASGEKHGKRDVEGPLDDLIGTRFVGKTCLYLIDRENVVILTAAWRNALDSQPSMIAGSGRVDTIGLSSF